MRHLINVFKYLIWAYFILFLFVEFKYDLYILAGGLFLFYSITVAEFIGLKQKLKKEKNLVILKPVVNIEIFIIGFLLIVSVIFVLSLNDKISYLPHFIKREYGLIAGINVLNIIVSIISLQYNDSIFFTKKGIILGSRYFESRTWNQFSGYNIDLVKSRIVLHYKRSGSYKLRIYKDELQVQIDKINEILTKRIPHPAKYSVS